MLSMIMLTGNFSSACLCMTSTSGPNGRHTAGSLGPPPIRGHETAAQHYFDAVYAKAAALAIALAAASGLLMTDDEDDESGRTA